MFMKSIRVSRNLKFPIVLMKKFEVDQGVLDLFIKRSNMFLDYAEALFELGELSFREISFLDEFNEDYSDEGAYRSFNLQINENRRPQLYAGYKGLWRGEKLNSLIFLVFIICRHYLSASTEERLRVFNYQESPNKGLIISDYINELNTRESSNGRLNTVPEYEGTPKSPKNNDADSKKKEGGESSMIYNGPQEERFDDNHGIEDLDDEDEFEEGSYF